MNSNLARTFTFLAVAVVLVLIAFMTVPGFRDPKLFDDKGEEFFPEFTDPTAATDLEILGFEADTASLKPFKVHFKKGRWSIPSHYDYPADAKDQMAEAAGILIGLKKDDIRSDLPEDHKLFGVIDPQDTGAESEGRGTRVTFKDGSGNTLATIILGKEIEGREGMRYVRIPEKKRTYAAKLPADVSTKFEDWIETDLLALTSSDVDQLRFDNYSIDEVTLAVMPGEKYVAKKDGTEWNVTELAEDEEVDKAKLGDVASAMGELKIVGVRPKPAGLSSNLTREQGIEFTPQTMMSLQQRGYFVGRDGTLFSNEGDLFAMTTSGIEYTLRFGEVLYGTGEALTAGSAQEPVKTGDQTEPEKETDGAANRYLMVTARFDPALLEKPEGTLLTQDQLTKRKTAQDEMMKIFSAVREFKKVNSALPATIAELTEGEEPLLVELKKDPWENDYVLEAGEEDKFTILSFGADNAKGGEGEGLDLASDNWTREDDLKEYADAMKEYTTKVTDGTAEAEKLNRRFAPWYYVIDDASFQKLHLARDQVVTKKEAEAVPTGETPDAPLFPDGNG